MPSQATGLEGEAHPGLKAVQEVGLRLEQRPPADRSAGFLIKDRLRRLGGRVNADETSRIGKQREETVRGDPERALDDDEVERPEIGGPSVERRPRLTVMFARP